MLNSSVGIGLVELKTCKRKRRAARELNEATFFEIWDSNDDDALEWEEDQALCSQVRTRVWAHPSSSHWWEDVAFPGWEENQWKAHLRMSKATFLLLTHELTPFIKTMDTVLRKAVPVSTKVAACLWRLATNEDYRSIGQRFGIGKSTACELTNLICQIISDQLYEKYVKWPKGTEAVKFVQAFYTKFHYPQCAGVVDGTHIPIISPEKNAADYFNRKGYHSLNMQAVVDASYRFTDVTIGWPGSVHDARVLRSTKLFQKGQEGSLFPSSLVYPRGTWEALISAYTRIACPAYEFAELGWWRKLNDIGCSVNQHTRVIAGVHVPIHIVGDGAYPHKTWLQKPYSGAHLSDGQQEFNRRLSQVRVTVEHAFGQLKGRWRCLLKRNDTTLNYVGKIVRACIILHNLCIECKETCPNDWLMPSPSGGSQGGWHEAIMDGPPEVIRQALMRHFVNKL